MHTLTNSTTFVRGIVMGRCSSSSSDSHGTEEKLSEDAAIFHSKLMVPGLAEKTFVGKISNSIWNLLLYLVNYAAHLFLTTIILDLFAIFSSINLPNNEINCKNREVVVLASPLLSLKSQNCWHKWCFSRCLKFCRWCKCKGKIIKTWKSRWQFQFKLKWLWFEYECNLWGVNTWLTRLWAIFSRRLL